MTKAIHYMDKRMVGFSSKVVYLACRSISEYLACFVDIQELEEQFSSSVTPLYCPEESPQTACIYTGSSTFTEICNLSFDELLVWSCMRLQQGIHHLPCCIVATDDEYALYGAAYSFVAGKRLLLWKPSQELDELISDIENTQSIMLALSPKKLFTLGIDRLRDVFNRNTLKRTDRNQISLRSWGILTASNAEVMARVVSRLRLRQPTQNQNFHVFANSKSDELSLDAPDFKITELPPHPDVQLLTQHNLPPFVAFSGHGRFYCALSGNLCSLDKPRKSDDQSCVGGYECAFPNWDRIPTSYLQLDTVIISSCSVANFQAPQLEKSIESNIAVRMFDGQANAVIAPWRSAHNPSFVSMLAWRLACRGLSIGEVCSRLNAVYRTWLNAPEPYLLLGDPEMKVYSQPYKQQRPLAVKQLQEGHWTLDLIGPFDGVEVRECFDTQLASATRNAPLSCVSILPEDSHAQIYVINSESDESAVEIIILWSAHPKGNNVQLELTIEEPFREEIAEVARQLQDVLPLRGPWHYDLSAHSATTMEHTETEYLDRVLRNFDRLVAATAGFGTFSPTLWRSLRQAEEQVLSACKHVNNNLIRHLINYTRKKGPFFPLEEFRSTLGVRYCGIERLSNSCPRCGGNIEQFRYRTGTWPSRKRCLLECERCVFFSDTEMGQSQLVLDAPHIAVKGQAVVVRISGKNTKNVLAIVDAAVISGFAEFTSAHFRVEPVIQSEIIAPNAEFCFNFELTFSTELPTHLATIHGLIVINGVLGWTANHIEMRAIPS